MNAGAIYMALKAAQDTQSEVPLSPEQRRRLMRRAERLFILSIGLAWAAAAFRVFEAVTIRS